ncbi:MAG: cupin domain-containing protein [Halobacteriales archaeon]
MAEVVDIQGLESTPHASVFEADRPQVVRLSLSAGEVIAPHSHPGTDVVLYVVEGRLRIALDDEVCEADAGEAALVSGERRISPTARTDATALIVFVPTDDA